MILNDALRATWRVASPSDTRWIWVPPMAGLITFTSDVYFSLSFAASSVGQDAASYVVFLIDGLGARLLERYAHAAPYLSSLLAGSTPATAGVPSTRNWCSKLSTRTVVSPVRVRNSGPAAPMMSPRSSFLKAA